MKNLVTAFGATDNRKSKAKIDQSERKSKRVKDSLVSTKSKGVRKNHTDQNTPFQSKQKQRRVTKKKPEIDQAAHPIYHDGQEYQSQKIDKELQDRVYYAQIANSQRNYTIPPSQTQENKRTDDSLELPNSSNGQQNKSVLLADTQQLMKQEENKFDKYPPERQDKQSMRESRTPTIVGNFSHTNKQIVLSHRQPTSQNLSYEELTQVGMTLSQDFNRVSISQNQLNLNQQRFNSCITYPNDIRSNECHLKNRSPYPNKNERVLKDNQIPISKQFEKSAKNSTDANSFENSIDKEFLLSQTSQSCGSNVIIPQICPFVFDSVHQINLGKNNPLIMKEIQSIRVNCMSSLRNLSKQYTEIQATMNKADSFIQMILDDDTLRELSDKNVDFIKKKELAFKEIHNQVTRGLTQTLQEYQKESNKMIGRTQQSLAKVFQCSLDIFKKKISFKEIEYLESFEELSQHLDKLEEMNIMNKRLRQIVQNQMNEFLNENNSTMLLLEVYSNELFKLKVEISYNNSAKIKAKLLIQ
ncbi:UNKNOWN [Stylonychia lemnae]|uniref:Uncharacterized protein n=1 Tax=Stylonychia lemnae TaxID=5949 RepID=A0A078B117_STYLE|nr:UNKNOWN [Stylonychia lemnae]|eukprot:CDW88031.1 UNKNOWN [Stylonychia lemnae]